MNKVTFTGRVGEVRWGYHRAATLDSWSISADTAGGTLTATVDDLDHFKVTQQPLTFVVVRQNGHEMSWPVESLQIADRTLTARVGPQK